MAEAAAAVGVTASAGELILCLFFDEFIAGMWILINALQLVVFLGIWQILFPHFLKVVLFELKRVSWGEYIEDFEIVQYFNEQIWGSDEEEEILEAGSDAIGIERLGSPNLFKNIGLSVIFMSLIFLLTAIMIALVDLCCRNKELSDKAKKRIEKMKREMKYNPLIRYMLLNSLNFNFSAICVFMHADSKIESKVFAAL